jgi:hypothetical protein
MSSQQTPSPTQPLTAWRRQPHGQSRQQTTRIRLNGWPDQDRGEKPVFAFHSWALDATSPSVFQRKASNGATVRFGNPAVWTWGNCVARCKRKKGGFFFDSSGGSLAGLWRPLSKTQDAGLAAAERARKLNQISSVKGGRRQYFRVDRGCYNIARGWHSIAYGAPYCNFKRQTGRATGDPSKPSKPSLPRPGSEISNWARCYPSLV